MKSLYAWHADFINICPGTRSGHDSILAFPPPSPPPTNPTLPYKDGVSEIRNVFIIAANLTFTPYNGLNTLFIYLLLNT